jgi:hypothetical protein
VSGQPKGDQPQRSACDYVGAFENEGPRRGGAWQPVNRRCREQIHLDEQDDDDPAFPTYAKVFPVVNDQVVAV